MKKVYLSPFAGEPLMEYLKSRDFRICFTDGISSVPEPIAYHPDMIMCKLGCEDSAPVFHGDAAKLGSAYPLDILYNGCCTGRYFIHNLKYTAPELLAAVTQSGGHEGRYGDLPAADCRYKKEPLLTVSVPQGYTKCNIVCVDENSIITSDAGIEKACVSAGLSVLKISPKNVLLPGYSYGFLGGTSGRIGREILFNGNLLLHPDFDKICVFVESRGLSCVYFKDYPLTDIGSVAVSKVIRPNEV